VEGQDRYIATVENSPAGNYAVTFRWEGKIDNDGWEGENGQRRYYHFMVLPEDLQDQEKGLSVRLEQEDLDAYPHNTVTMSTGIGSILRIPIRPLIRDQQDGGIRIGGYVSKYDGFLANLLKRGTPDESKRVLYRGSVEDIKLTFTDGSVRGYALDTSTFDHFERYPFPNRKTTDDLQLQYKIHHARQ